MTLADGLNQSWAILKMVLPSLGLTGILLGTFYGGRFSVGIKSKKRSSKLCRNALLMKSTRGIRSSPN